MKRYEVTKKKETPNKRDKCIFKYFTVEANGIRWARIEASRKLKAYKLVSIRRIK